MLKMEKDIKETKEKIIEALEGVKEFELVWTEEITYSKIVKAKSEEEAREMFEDGDVDLTDSEMGDSNFCGDSLEVYEV